MVGIMRRASFISLLLVISVCGAWGLINPDYTPVELVRDSETILQGTVWAPQEDSGKLSVTSLECLKGKAPARLVLRYGESAVSGAEGLRTAFGTSRTKEVMLFLGDLSKASMTGEGEGDSKPVGTLRVGLKWFGLFPGGEGALEIGKDPLNLKAVWAGSTDMLARLVRYVLTDERAEVPATAGVSWKAAVVAGTVTGKVNGCLIVDVNPVGRCLVVLSDAGDRAFRVEPGSKEVREITASLQLDTKSKWAACRVEPSGGMGEDWRATTDFDNDGIPDVVQGGPAGMAFSSGLREGGFRSPQTACEVNQGGRPTAILVGDYDADGYLDLTLAGKNGPLQLANAGKGRFETVHEETGELAYYGEPGVSAAVGFDVNNDGREELALMYPDAPPLFLFNRGFRCFGRALPLAMDNAQIPNTQAVAAGQQAAAAGDLDGDGLQEVVVVGAKGELVVLFQQMGSRPRLCLEVYPAPGVPCPVTVVGYDGKRCLGARVATATVPAFFGKTGKGAIQLKWKGRGGQDRTETVPVLKPTRFTLRME